MCTVKRSFNARILVCTFMSTSVLLDAEGKKVYERNNYMYEADSSDSGCFATVSFMISRVDLLPDRRFSFAFTALVYLVIIFNPKRIKSFLDVTTSLRILLVFSQKTHQPKFSSVWLVATGPFCC